MLASIAYEYFATYIPRGSRKPRTEAFAAKMEVDVPEISSFDAPDAVHVEFAPTGWTDRDLIKMRNAVGLGYNDALSFKLRLDGHDGRLWRDCWRYSRERFHELVSPRLRGEPLPYRNDGRFNQLRALWASTDGKGEAPSGFLHWLDVRTNCNYELDTTWQGTSLDRIDPCVIRFNGEATGIGNLLTAPINAKEIISTNRTEKAAHIVDHITRNFVMADGRLRQAVQPPALRVKRQTNGASGYIDMYAQEPSRLTRASAWFRFDEREEWLAMCAEVAGKRGEPYFVNYAPEFRVLSLDPRFLYIDKTDRVIRSIQSGIMTLASNHLHQLSDEALRAFITMRRQLDAWNPETGNPKSVIDAVHALLALVDDIPNRTYFRNRTYASLMQAASPGFNLSPRGREDAPALS